MADPKVAYTDDDGKSGISALSEQSSVVDERLLRTVEGRKFNTLTETYFLPADEDEWSRLNKQHMAIGLGLQGLFPNGDIVRAILQTKDGEGKSILDLGCGTGVWSVNLPSRIWRNECFKVSRNGKSLSSRSRCWHRPCSRSN